MGIILMPMSTIASRYTSRTLAEVIAHQGRRQDWIAKRTGLSESMLSMVISGQRTINEESAQRIAAALQVPLFLLFDMSIGNEDVTIDMETAA